MLMLKLALLFMVSASAFAQPAAMGNARQIHVDAGIDHERIVVNGARGEFRSLRILVKNNGIRLTGVGSLQRWDHHSGANPGNIRSGGQSRIIDLPPGRAESGKSSSGVSAQLAELARPRLSLFGLK